MQLIIDNLAVSYDQTSGDGKLMLMIHGWGSNKEAFASIRSEFASDYRVVAVDLPGFGGSQSPDSGWGIPEYADFVKQFCGKIGAEPDVLVGHSMGGRIAVYLGSEGAFPDTRFVLLGAAGFNESSTIKNKTFKAAAKAGKAMTGPLPKGLQSKLKSKLYQAAGTTDYLQSGNLKETFGKVIDLDLTEHAKKVKNKTLLIYGVNDKSAPPSYGERYNELMDNSELHILDNAAHYVHHDQPQEVIKLMKDFLK